ncbi:MAG TPA: class I SAM-dependent methyltransferase [Bryobacteraceae bacterium]|jgi:SAM-dependent methyltransferase
MAKADRLAINSSYFDGLSAHQFASGSPHMAHASLRALWRQLVRSVYSAAADNINVPKVLDLGAGDGFASLAFLEQGASVTAVDSSVEPLRRLWQYGAGSNRLTIREQSVEDYLQENHGKFDIAVASSLLHHVPDYLAVVSKMAALTEQRGQILLFQDPLRYDTQGYFTRGFAFISYFFWRMLQPDLGGGIRRRLRRMRGVYLDDCPQDQVEYHVVRNGVDQDAIVNLLRARGFEVKIIQYWSQQSGLFQALGTRLGLTNSFAIHATLRDG